MVGGDKENGLVVKEPGEPKGDSDGGGGGGDGDGDDNNNETLQGSIETLQGSIETLQQKLRNVVELLSSEDARMVGFYVCGGHGASASGCGGGCGCDTDTKLELIRLSTKACTCASPQNNHNPKYRTSTNAEFLLAYLKVLVRTIVPWMSRGGGGSDDDTVGSEDISKLLPTVWRSITDVARQAHQWGHEHEHVVREATHGVLENLNEGCAALELVQQLVKDTTNEQEEEDRNDREKSQSQRQKQRQQEQEQSYIVKLVIFFLARLSSLLQVQVEVPTNHNDNDSHNHNHNSLMLRKSMPVLASLRGLGGGFHQNQTKHSKKKLGSRVEAILVTLLKKTSDLVLHVLVDCSTTLANANANANAKPNPTTENSELGWLLLQMAALRYLLDNENDQDHKEPHFFRLGEAILRHTLPRCHVVLCHGHERDHGHDHDHDHDDNWREALLADLVKLWVRVCVFVPEAPLHWCLQWLSYPAPLSQEIVLSVMCVVSSHNHHHQHHRSRSRCQRWIGTAAVLATDPRTSSSHAKSLVTFLWRMSSLFESHKGSNNSTSIFHDTLWECFLCRRRRRQSCGLPGDFLFLLEQIPPATLWSNPEVAGEIQQFCRSPLLSRTTTTTATATTQYPTYLALLIATLRGTKTNAADCFFRVTHCSLSTFCSALVRSMDAPAPKHTHTHTHTHTNNHNHPKPTAPPLHGRMVQRFHRAVLVYGGPAHVSSTLQYVTSTIESMLTQLQQQQQQQQQQTLEEGAVVVAVLFEAIHTLGQAGRHLHCSRDVLESIARTYRALLSTDQPWQVSVAAMTSLQTFASSLPSQHRWILEQAVPHHAQSWFQCRISWLEGNNTTSKIYDLSTQSLLCTQSLTSPMAQHCQQEQALLNELYPPHGGGSGDRVTIVKGSRCLLLNGSMVLIVPPGTHDNNDRDDKSWTKVRDALSRSATQPPNRQFLIKHVHATPTGCHFSG